MGATIVFLIALRSLIVTDSGQDYNKFNLATIEGIYKFADGDTFTYSCGGGVCHDVLIRDKFLQDNVIELNGKTITITVERVVACAHDQPIIPACIGNPSGTALKIIAWIKPKYK